MSAFTSDATGNWSADATWSGTGVPTIGDTATIGNAAHVITVDVNTVVGTSPAADTTVLTVTGIIDIASGVTFDVRGAITYTSGGAGGKIRYTSGGAGGRLRLDNIPDGVTYSHKISTSNSNTTAMLQITGNATTPFTLDFAPAGTTGGGTISAPNIGGGLVKVQYANVTLGSSAVNIAFWSYNAAGFDYYWKNCTFTNCGQIRDTGSITANMKFNLLDNKHVTTAGSTVLRAGSTATGTGERNVLRCDFDKTIEGLGVGWTLEDCVLRDSFLLLGSFGGKWASFARNVVIHDNLTDQNIFGDLTDVYYCNTASGTNLHGMTPPSSVTADITVDGVIYDTPSTVNTSGDMFLLPSSTSVRTWTVQNCLLLPRRGTTTAPGVLVSAGGAASGLTVNILHNTVCAAGASGATGVLSVGETNPGYAGMIPAVKSNIVWAATDSVVVGDNGTPADDMITDADYNLGFNTTGGSAFSTNYEASVSNAFLQATPGPNDVNVNPQFLDPTRNITTWGTVVLGGSPTITQILDHIWTNGVAGQIAALTSYVRAGFSPTNATVQNAGHDSVTIGAVEFTPAGAATAFPGVGAVTLAGLAPTATGGGGAASVTAGLGVLTLTGRAPTVGAGNTVAFLVLNGATQRVLVPEFEENEPQIIGDESRAASGSLRGSISAEKRRFRFTLLEMTESEYATVKAMGALGASVNMTGACIAGSTIVCRMTVSGSFVPDPADPTGFLVRPEVELVEV